MQEMVDEALRRVPNANGLFLNLKIVFASLPCIRKSYNDCESNCVGIFFEQRTRILIRYAKSLHSFVIISMLCSDAQNGLI